MNNTDTTKRASTSQNSAIRMIANAIVESMNNKNNRRHWNESDFVVVQQGGWNEQNQYGYCRKCTGDMQRLSDGILRHYNSHSWVKRSQKTILTISGLR